MESTGPTTRSRARAGAPTSTSAIPSTRRKPATRSTRKSSVPPSDPEANQEAQAVQVEVAAVNDVPTAVSNKSNAEPQSDVPATAADPGTSAIAGLTPVTAVTPCYTAATPTTMGPSPVMPIKLDSLWSPEVPPSICPQLEASEPCTTIQDRSADAGVDLAAMFISTPAPSTAANDAGASPVEGLVSAEAPADASANSTQSFLNQPFGGFAETALSHSTAADVATAEQTPAITETQQQQEVGGFGSPAAMEDAAIAEIDAAEPLAPMSLSHHPTPVPSSPAAISTRSTPAAPSAAPSRSSGRTPGRASKSPAPAGTPASPFPESDDDMPEAESEYPEEKTILAEALAETLTLQSQQADAAAEAEADAADTQMQPSEEAKKELQAGDLDQKQGQFFQKAAETEQELLSEEDLLHDLHSSEFDHMEDAAVPAAMEESADVMEEEQPEPELPAASEAEATATAAATPAEAVIADLDMQPLQESETAVEEDAVMDAADSPAAAAALVSEAPPSEKTTAVCDVVNHSGAMSPDVMSSAFNASATAGCYTANPSTTAALPKSAMAKPKSSIGGEGTESQRKSAHVMLPDPSPGKSSVKPTTGRASVPGGAAGIDGSSPGHTPFPTKSKIRAATNAADRAAAAAAAGKEVSLKKEIAYSRAHSALKQYISSSSKKTDQHIDQGADGSSPDSSDKNSSGSGGKVVSSRLLQPTASSMAKHRNSMASDVDPYVWPAPESESAVAAAAAPAGISRPRLASKVVVPSPPLKVEPSMKALKRAIKDKTEQKAKATLEEHRSSADIHRVEDVNAIRASRKSSKAPAHDELEYDDEDYDADHDQDVAGDLADSLAGLSVGEVRIAKPAGPLKGVAAPAGKHFVFDDEGKPKETPSSKLRSGPKHTYFDDDGRPIGAPAMPRWR